MIRVSRTFNVYKFDELSEKIKDKVVNNFINNIIQYTDFERISKNSNLYKAYKKANDMQTIWFLGSYIWEYCEKWVLKEIRKNDYLKNGEIFFMEDNDIVEYNNVANNRVEKFIMLDTEI